MKKIILLLIVLTIASVCFGQKAKFGHINSEEVFKNLPERENIAKDAEDFAKNLENQLQVLNREMEEKYTDYMANEAEYSPSIKQMKYEELTNLQQRIQAFQIRAQEDMQAKEQELLSPLYDKIKNAIKEVGEEKGLIYVFDQNTVLYISSESVDLTKDVMTRLGIK